MAVGVVGVSSNSSAGTTISQLVVSKPTGAGDGHLGLAFVNWNGQTTETVTANGWTQVTEILYGSAGKFVLLRRDLATADTDYTFNFSTSRAGIVIGIIALSDQHGTPIDVFDESASAQATTVDAPSLTPTNADEFLICAWGWQNSVTMTPPNPMVEQLDVASTVGTFRGLGIATDQLSGSSATGVRTTQLSGIDGANGGAGISVLIIPDAGGGGGITEELRPDAILEQSNDTKTLTDLQRDVP